MDLDETIVHTDFKNLENCDVRLEVDLPISKEKVKFGLWIRPGLLECLTELKKYFDIVIYTASMKSYADVILGYLEQKDNFFCLRLYRNSCIPVIFKQHLIYLKDLRIFEGVDLRKVVIVDNSVKSFANQISNGIPILPYLGNSNDIELSTLKTYLTHLSKVQDVRVENRKFLNLENYCFTIHDHSSASNGNISNDFLTHPCSKTVLNSSISNESCSYLTNFMINSSNFDTESIYNCLEDLSIKSDSDYFSEIVG